MFRLCVWLFGGFALLARVPLLRADPPAARDARTLAARIDHFLGRGWQAAGLTPAARADDAEFLRRVYLDVAGRIPSVADARRFLDDRRADRRERLIDELLDGPRYAVHFSRTLRAQMLPEVASSNNGAVFAPGFENWLHQHLAAGTGYDQIVYQLLTTPVRVNDPLSYIADGFQGKPTPNAFFVIQEGQPGELAASTARVFLGIRLGCARCHDHPFAEWKKEQFWSLAAFFAGLQRKKIEGTHVPIGERTEVRSIPLPNSATVIQAAHLDGTLPKFRDGVSARVTLAQWVTSRDNPYFARAAANRLWAHFFGTGLIEPVDEMVGADIQASHPELLDELARAFVASGFDLKFLARAITNSRAYQLTSAGAPAAHERPDRFARMPLRGLTGEQVFDSLAQATGHYEKVPRDPTNILPGAPPTLRPEILLRFDATGEKATEFRTSILHALTLMNGKLVRDATGLEHSRTLGAVAATPFLTTPERLEILYLSALSRYPRAAEAARLGRYLDSRGAPGTAGYNRALSDVFWALLNSAEFLLNH